MTVLSSSRPSRSRQLLMAAAGILLLVAALDIVNLHVLSDPPTTDSNGVLTSKGVTERRTDVAWGALLAASGATLAIVGLGGLVLARPKVELTDKAIRLRVAGPLSMLDIPWEDVVSVRSGSDHEDDGEIPTPVLLIEVADRYKYPDGLWGAVWKGAILQVDAQGWDNPVEDVAIRAELRLNRPWDGEYQ